MTQSTRYNIYDVKLSGFSHEKAIEIEGAIRERLPHGANLARKSFKFEEKRIYGRKRVTLYTSDEPDSDLAASITGTLLEMGINRDCDVYVVSKIDERILFVQPIGVKTTSLPEP